VTESVNRNYNKKTPERKKEKRKKENKTTKHIMLP